MGVKNAVKRKSINNSETPNKLRKTNGVVNKKSPKTFTKKQKTPPNRNKQIPEEEEEECFSSSESEYEGGWKVEDLTRKYYVSNEEESNSDEDQNDNEEEEVEQNDSDEDIDINEDSDENISEDFDDANDDEEESDSDEENIEVERNYSDEEIDMNEESDSQDFEDANEEESDYEDQNDSENDSDEESILQDFEDADSEQESDSNDEISEDQNDNEKKELSKSTITHLNRCKYTVYVTGFQGTDIQIPNLFKDCKYTYYTMLKNDKIDKPASSAFVNFDEEENYKKALEKNGTVINGVTITVLPRKSKKEENLTHNIFVRNLNPTSKIENIFSDCKIITHRMYPYNNSAFLHLGNEDSIQKALKKHRTEHDGYRINVYRNDCNVFVKRFPKNIKVEDFFSNCKIRSSKLFKYKKNLNGTVYFEDILSYKNAIAKNGTEINGKTIIVEPVKPIEDKKTNDKKKQFKPRTRQLSMNKKNLESESRHKSILLRNKEKIC